jgi:Transglutaminase-like superfamily
MLESVRSNLVNTQADRDSWKAKFVDAQAEGDSWKAKFVDAQAEGDSWKAKFVDAQAERDSWKAKFEAIPTETARAVQLVRDEVTYVKHTFAQQGRSMPDGYLSSLAIMNYVVGHVTAPEYGFRHEIAMLPLPVSDVETILQMQAGICGNASFAFAGIAHNLGLPVRSVQFYYGTDNHIAVETYYEGGWHYFDPTWGLVYGDGLSITAARASANPQPRYDSTLLWKLTAPSSLTNFSVLTAPSTVVDIDKQPL